MPEQIPGVAQTLEPLVVRLLCDNHSPFTNTGTQTHLVGTSDLAVIDPGPDDPAHGAAVFVSMVDTPNGRLTVNCATRPDEIESALNQFRSIRASITLPGATP